MFEGKTGRPASGVTDASGRFTLETFGRADGAITGDQTVVISKYVWPEGQSTKTIDPRSSGHSERQVIPPRYTASVRSPLHVTVTSGGDNDFTFDLTD